MALVLVTAKYIKKVNMVREHRVKIVDSIEKADKWLDETKQPAMYYAKGSFDTSFPQYCRNEQYKKEYAKVID